MSPGDGQQEQGMKYQTKTARLFALLHRRWLTADDAQRCTGVRSLAQRVSVWRAQGTVILDRWVKSGTSRFKAYFIPRSKC